MAHVSTTVETAAPGEPGSAPAVRPARRRASVHAPAAPASRGGLVAAIAVLVLLSTLTKCWVVLAPRVDLLGPGTHDMPNVAVAEEFHRGNVAQEVLDGPLLPLLDHAYAPFFGGSVVLGVVAAPLFALFGPNVFALKLASILFQAVAVACVVALLHRRAGAAAAWMGGLVLALPPPGYGALSIVAWGSHCEANACILLALLLADRAFAAGRTARLRQAAFGAALGFGVWFDYATSIGAAAIVLAALATPREAWRRFAPIPFAIGAAVGFAPWLLYNATNDFQGLLVYGAAPGQHVLDARSWTAAPGVVLDLVTAHSLAFATFVFEPAAARAVVAVGLVVLAALVWAARVEQRAHPSDGAPFLDPLRVGCVWLAVFAFVYALERFHVDPARVPSLRYLAPMVPALALVAGGLVGRAWLGRGRRVGTIALVAWLAYGSAAWIASTDATRVGVLWERAATSPRVLARWTAMRYGDDPDRLVAALHAARERRPVEFQAEYVDGLARTLQWLASDTDELEPYHAQRRDAYRRSLDVLGARAPDPWRARFVAGP